VLCALVNPEAELDDDDIDNERYWRYFAPWALVTVALVVACAFYI
jgi:hypothetical protein